MRKNILKIFVMLSIICLTGISGMLLNPAFAATPADQTFDGKGASGTNTITLDGIQYTTNNGGRLEVAGCDTLTYNPGSANIVHYSGNALTNDLDFICDSSAGHMPTMFQISSLDLSDNFRMTSMYLIINDVESCGHKFDIRGYDGGTGGKLVAEVKGIDMSASGKYGSGIDAVTLANEINDSTHDEYGGVLTFGSNWNDIDTILITNNAGGTKAVYAVVDSLDFSNVVDDVPTSQYLSNLTISSGTITPAFNKNTYSYTATVGTDVTSITVTPTAEVPVAYGQNATIKVNGVAVASGAGTPVNLALGVNTINIDVTSAVGGVTQRYVLKVTRVDTYLSNIVIQASKSVVNIGTFNMTTTSYTGASPNADFLRITPTVHDPKNVTVTMKYGDMVVIIPSENVIINIPVTPNEVFKFRIIINSNSNPANMLTYNFAIMVGAPPPSVGLSISDSSFSETGGATTITATLSNKSYQPVTVNLSYSGTATSGVDYTKSDSIVIPAGSLSNSITITGVDDTTYEGNETVIADIDSVTNGTEDVTQQVTATIIDDEPTSQYLSNLTISSGTLTPAFNKNTYSYTATVGTDVTSITVTPTAEVPVVYGQNATITVNGVAVASGAGTPVNLALGVNTINIDVTSAIGKVTQRYVLTVTRVDTYLSNITATAIMGTTSILQGTFDKTVTTYDGSIGATSKIKITATADSPQNVTLKIVNVTRGEQGTAATSGTTLPISVTTGTTNIINIIVTWTSTGDTKTYTCNIAVGS